MLQNMKGCQHTSDTRNRQLSSRNTAASAKIVEVERRNTMRPALAGLQQTDLKCALLPPFTLHSKGGNILLLARPRPPGAAILSALQTLLPFTVYCTLCTVNVTVSGGCWDGGLCSSLSDSLFLFS